MIKEEQQHQSLDLVSFIENIKEKVFDRQERELIKAVRCTGQYRLAASFKRYTISETRWMEMNEEQRKAEITKVFSTSPGIDHLTETPNVEGKKMKINIDEIKSCINLPIHTLKRLWMKAEYILDSGSVVPLPTGNFYITDDEFGYNVCENKKLKSWCCNCKDASTTGGICPHLLVLHNEFGSLANYLEEYARKKGVAALIIEGNAPSRMGEKPCQKKKRRGANNVRTEPITSMLVPMKIISGPNGMNHVFDPQWDAPKQCSHMDYWHNDEMFLIESTKSRNGKKAKTCISCQRCFPKRNPCIWEKEIQSSHIRSTIAIQ